MSNRKKRFELVLEFILNEAEQAELDVLASAVERRKGTRPPENTGDLNFNEMANNITQKMGKQFSMPQMNLITKQTRGLVRNMILQQEPGISQEHLEALLDQYVPAPGSGNAPANVEREKAIPLDALMTMLEQFVQYSMGRLGEADDKALRDQMPDWPTRYWEIFAPNTRLAVTDLLHGKMDTKEFWDSAGRILAANRA